MTLRTTGPKPIVREAILPNDFTNRQFGNRGIALFFMRLALIASGRHVEKISPHINDAGDCGACCVQQAER